MNAPAIIRHSLVVAADRDRVWHAITQPKHFSRWFGDEVQFEHLAVGEKMVFFPNSIKAPGTIAVVEPTERFAYRWPAAMNRPETTLVTFLLETVAEGTRITVTEEGFDALPADLSLQRRDENGEGWSIQLQNIAAYLRDGNDAND